MGYIFFVIGVALFVIAGIHQIAWLGLLSIFVSITAMLVGGRAPARWVRVRTFVRQPTQQIWSHAAARPASALRYHIRRVSRQGRSTQPAMSSEKGAQRHIHTLPKSDTP